MVMLQAIEFSLTSLITYGASFAFIGLLLLSAAELLKLIIHIFMFVIFVQIILSWISLAHTTRLRFVLHQLSEPLLRPARRINAFDPRYRFFPHPGIYLFTAVIDASGQTPD